MPNWATTTLRIANTHDHAADPDSFDRAQEVLRALVSGLSTDARTYGDMIFTETTLDFNTILPMPEELRSTSSPITVVDTVEEAQRRNDEYSDIATQLGAGETHAIDAETAARWRRDYGAIDWYGWANSTWGTKWNASDVTVHANTVDDAHLGEIPALVLTMDTAWTEPTGVIDHLIESGLAVSGGVIHEDGNEFVPLGAVSDFETYFTVGEEIDLFDEDNPDEGSWTRRWIDVRDCACDSCCGHDDA